MSTWSQLLIEWQKDSWRCCRGPKGLYGWDSVAAKPTQGLGSYLPSMARVVVVLLRQCDDQLKIGLPWIKVHILSLVIDWAISPKCKCRRVGPPPMSLGVRGMGITVSMAECEGLALVTLDRIEKWPSKLKWVSEGCDTWFRAWFQYLS
jgi:hypothetical protein